MIRRRLSTRVLTALAFMIAAAAGPKAAETLHYAPNGNFGQDGSFAPATAGFNVADVNHIDQPKSLPPGAKGLVWVGQCNGVDAAFLARVRPFVGDPGIPGSS